MVRKFTEKLVEMNVNQGIGLCETLEIMANEPDRYFFSNKRIKKTAVYLLENLRKGNLFSIGIKTCPYIAFDDTYVNFISLAENTGNLGQTLIFLNQKYSRNNEIKSALIEAFLYPCFVMIMGIASVFYVVNFMGIGNQMELIKYVLLLIGFVTSSFCITLRLMGNNPLYEAFLAIDFLIQSGVNISGAVTCAVRIVGAESNYGKKLENAREKLEFGVPLHFALDLGNRYDEAFYFAEKAGGKTEVFGKLALWINEKDKKKRRIYLRLLEPFYIAGTGIFLLLIILKFFLPVMTNFTFL